jgi:ubiquitin carboxyl-terminal hydrolase 5/13
MPPTLTKAAPVEALQAYEHPFRVVLQGQQGLTFGEGRRHAFLHYEKTGHALGVVIKRTRKEPTKRVRGPPLSLAQAHTQDSSDSLIFRVNGLSRSRTRKASEGGGVAVQLVIGRSGDGALRCFACSTPGEAIHSEDQRVGSLSSLWRKVAHHRSLLSLPML